MERKHISKLALFKCIRFSHRTIKRKVTNSHTHSIHSFGWERETNIAEHIIIVDYTSTWRPIVLNTTQIHGERESLSGKVYNLYSHGRWINFQEHISCKTRNYSELVDQRPIHLVRPKTYPLYHTVFPVNFQSLLLLFRCHVNKKGASNAYKVTATLLFPQRLQKFYDNCIIIPSEIRMISNSASSEIQVLPHKRPMEKYFKEA